MGVKKKQHPSVQQFKEFVRKHPKLIQEVRSGTKTWQQFYEEWYLLGESDEMWNAYKPEGEASTAAAAQGNADGPGFMGQMMTFIKNIDMDQLQTHLASVTSAIGSVQQVIQQFQGNKAAPQQQQQNNPFFFQKD
ncbi:YlbD family protein [Ectobacillus ponti]|uniref:YlbD family protein n=1 Tax=Ectobacillus ponti TaxID=2961894 RepID=A0AA42BRC6_9BACI|nr:YlbD family protein [Ectobacillus ponti]MCP8970271.1 YlbD family protein [Ectobacillus ponti]